jgi:nucleotidyltransferase/DNA polymerase involved in DNA repair
METKFSFVGGKSGMDGVDQDKINRLVEQASIGTQYYKKQLAQKAELEERLNKIKKKVEEFLKNKQLVHNTQTLIDKKIETYDKERQLDRIWVTFDLDMFYVACEIRDNPELKDKPVTVGSMTYTHTANYIARQYGIKCNMPGFIAKKLCPELIIIRGNYHKYHEASTKFVEVINKYDPKFELKGKGDEASFDFTEYIAEKNVNTFEGIEKLCSDIRMEINKATGITVSCGIGPNKMLSKMSADRNKPNGQFLLRPDREEIEKFIQNLPIRKIPGIGVIHEQILNGLGVKSCQDILDHAVKLTVAFTENTVDFFIRSALGISSSLHEAPEDRKSVRVGYTFMVDDFTHCAPISDVNEMHQKIKHISEDLSESLKDYQLSTKQITIMIKTHEFNTTSKAMMLDKYINDAATIEKCGVQLLTSLLPVKPLRQIVLTATRVIKESELHSGLDKFFKSKESGKKAESVGEGSNTFDTIPDFPDQEIAEVSISEVGDQIKDTFSNSKTFEETDCLPHKENKENFSELKEIQENSLSNISCPICNVRFESTVNKTRINNHIDRCLNPKPSADPQASSSKIQESPVGNNQSSSLKRKATEPLENPLTKKKVKITKTEKPKSKEDITKFFIKK